MLNINSVTCQIGKEEILYVTWVDYDPFMKFNFEMYFFNIIELVNKSNITKLVLDCSLRSHDPSERDFKEIYELLLSGLSATKLEKMARICPASAESNSQFNRYLKEIKTNLNLSFQLYNFKNAESALAWLAEDSLQYSSQQERSA